MNNLRKNIDILIYNKIDNKSQLTVIINHSYGLLKGKGKLTPICKIKIFGWVTIGQNAHFFPQMNKQLDL